MNKEGGRRGKQGASRHHLNITPPQSASQTEPSERSAKKEKNGRVTRCSQFAVVVCRGLTATGHSLASNGTGRDARGRALLTPCARLLYASEQFRAFDVQKNTTVFSCTVFYSRCRYRSRRRLRWAREHSSTAAQTEGRRVSTLLIKACLLSLFRTPLEARLAALRLARRSSRPVEFTSSSRSCAQCSKKRRHTSRTPGKRSIVRREV